MKLRWIEKSIEKEILVDNPIESNFNEELDSATVKILSQTVPLDIEILDEVAIVDSENRVFKYFCIADYEERMMNPSNPHYDYTLSLASQTKEMEGIVLPNLSVTKTDKNRSVLYYLNNYLNIYGPKIRKNGPIGRLPSAYREVEYIESNGIQYIDTGITPNQGTGLKVDYMQVQLFDVGERGIAGTRYNDHSQGFCFGYYGTDKARFAQYGSELYSRIEWEPGTITYGREVLDTRVYQNLKGELIVDDLIVHSFVDVDSFKGYGNIYLFAINEPTVRASAMRLYGCEIYQDEILVRQFVPCYRVADAVSGLFDLVEGIFYENDGNGDFVRGPVAVLPQGINLQSKWHLSPEAERKFRHVRCPEMQWNRPTFREVFNDLMMVDNCIPVLDNNEIGIIDLSHRLPSELDGEYVNSVSRSKSIDDYTTEVEMELQNVIQDSADGVYNLTNIVEYTGFRNEDEYVLTTENAKIYTKNAIYDVKHFWLCVNLKLLYFAYAQYDYVEIDLCDIEGLNFVREYKEYMTLPIAYDTSDTATLEAMNQYQNFNLSYSRGGKEINGLFDETKKFWFVNLSFLELLLGKVVEKLQNPAYGPVISWGTYLSGTITDKIDIKDISFKIEYQCLANTKFRAGKYLPYKNERIIVDNQTNSFVNANKQGILEYLKANRLGNEVLTINSRYDDLSSEGLVEVGSVYDGDYVIFKRQVQVNPNYISVMYYATKHYILRDYFTGVKAKIRSWKIESEESLVRNELHKYYYEFSFEDRVVDDRTHLPIPETVMLSSFFTHFDDEIMKYAFLQSMVGYDESINGPSERLLPAADFYLQPTDYQYILTELNSKTMGNTIVFDTQMMDNWSAGVRVAGMELINLTSQTVEKDVRYVDGIGEAMKVYFTMASPLSVYKSDSPLWEFPIEEPDDSLWFKKYSMSGLEGYNVSRLFTQKPLATSWILPENAERYNETFEIRKDQREITALSLQLEFCSITENIVFGSQFVKDNNLISTNYRTKYVDNQYTVTATLATNVIYNDVNDLPEPIGGDLAIIVTVQSGGSVVGSNYYISRQPDAYGVLLDRNITRSKDTVLAMGSQLDGKYVIGVEGAYVYPITQGEDYRDLATTDIPEALYALNRNYPVSRYRINQYILAWYYEPHRTLSTTALQFRYYENVSIGGSTGESTTANNTYKIVKHVSATIRGELADEGTYTSVPSWLHASEGEYLVLYQGATYRLYVYQSGSWNLVQYMPSSADKHNIYTYNGRYYYWNISQWSVWDESSNFEYDLLKSNGSEWILQFMDYTTDQSNIYYYPDATTYRKWINGAWSSSVTGTKTYVWFINAGEWVYNEPASTDDKGYLGTTPDSTSTKWYSFGSGSWSFIGNTTIITVGYSLYTYSGGNVVAVSNDVLNNNLFRDDGRNYVWDVTDVSTNEGTWKLDEHIEWDTNNPISATRKYFEFDGKVYLCTDEQLIYQQSRSPERNVNREDLRLFISNTEKVRIYDIDFFPESIDRQEITGWSYTIGNNFIEINGLNGKATYYITDSDENVLLAFNAPDDTSTSIRIYLNGYVSRNKKIYN